MKTKLNKIAEKYKKIETSKSNYYIGGGLDCEKFASNRHENAKNDESRITLGKANQLFKKVTGLDIDIIKEIINYAVPNMEWHHAGALPKSYGGGMKKTYFLNSNEIVYIAENFENLKEKIDIRREYQKRITDEKNNKYEKQLKFLKKYAEKLTRIEEKPKYFHETNSEMDGKYGWFCSYNKSYNMTEYYTGWKFKSEKKYKEFNKLLSD